MYMYSVHVHVYIDRLESMWSQDIFGQMMATNNAVMQEDRVSDK